MEPQHISNYLDNPPNQVQVNQGLKLLKSGEENALAVAISSPLIIDSSQEEIKQVLRLVMMKVGLRSQNLPSDEEKAVLIHHIATNFGGHRVEEIKLAFEMAISNKLGLKPEDSKCYENFSCAYFSTIMGAYRIWAEDAIKSVVVDIPPPQKIFTQEELDDSAREDVERQYQLFLKNHELRGVSINKSILEKDGLIKPEESVIDFFKRRIENGFANIYIKNA